LAKQQKIKEKSQVSEVFWKAFCHKIGCVSIQNAFRFGTKRIPFRYKTQSILAQNAIRFDTKRETISATGTRSSAATTKTARFGRGNI
jgi:hypothetical protein